MDWQSSRWLRINSVVGSDSVVDHVLSIRLSGHPVTEEEGGEEWDEDGVVLADTPDIKVESVADQPCGWENSFNLLY